MDAPLRIGMVAPLWESIPPATYGGIEYIVHLLCEGLRARGHQVTLFASGNSRTTATLAALSDTTLTELMETGVAWDYTPYLIRSAVEAIRRGSEFDVIHSHLDHSTLSMALLSRTPVIHTLHGAVTADDKWTLNNCSRLRIVALTRSQIRAVGNPDIEVIANGIPFQQFKFSPNVGNYLMFLGRMAARKAPHVAIAVAKATGMRIVLGGAPMNSQEKHYFASEVQPHIDGETVVYAGLLDQAQKIKLLSGAAALLFPVEWEEPFGLVMIEAMACGTPVVALARGSVPEIIDPGLTGFYGETLEDLISLVPSAARLNRSYVRSQAAQRFDSQRMIEAYLSIYRKVAVEQSRDRAITGRTKGDKTLLRTSVKGRRHQPC